MSEAPVTVSGPFPVRMDLPGDSDPRWAKKKPELRRVRRPRKVKAQK